MSLVWRVASIVVTAIAILSVAGALLERPTILSYISSDSMSPTLNKNDLIFINPIPGSYDVGDIIVFYTGEKWVCHRIFAVTENGYITKGDNNIAVDQIEGVPEVKPDKIAGKVVTIGGKPVKIPGVGDKIDMFSSFVVGNKFVSILIFAAAGSYQFLNLSGRRKKLRKIKVSYSKFFFASSLLIITSLTILSSMMIKNVNIQYGTTLAGNVRPEWVYPGSVFEKSVKVENNGVYPFVYVVTSKSDRATVNEAFLLYPGERRVVSVTIRAPLETSIYAEKTQIARFIPLVTPELAKKLSLISPFLVVLFIDFEVVVLLAVIYKLTESKERYRVRVPRWVRI